MKNIIEDLESVLDANERDSITKLYTKESCERAAAYLESCGVPYSYIRVNIDNSRYVSMTFGNDIGESSLRVIGDIIRDHAGNAVVGRVGNDEFLVIAVGVESYEDIWEYSRVIKRAIADTELPDTNGVHVTATLGIARFPEDGGLDDIIRKADIAMYRGKQKGKNCFIIYLQDIHGSITKKDPLEHMYIETELTMKLSAIMNRGRGTDNCIGDAVRLLSDELMIDHLCIQTDTVILWEAGYRNHTGNYYAFDTRYIKEIENSKGLMIVDSPEKLRRMRCNELLNMFSDQLIRGCVTVRIHSGDRYLGYLRADSAAPDGRAWRDSDILHLGELAAFIGLYMERDKELTDEYERVRGNG